MLLVPTATGAQIPLKELADIDYTRGAQMIQSENTFLVGYVIFDKTSGKAEVDVVKEATRVLDQKIKDGELTLAKGVSYKFAGNYEQQERATQRLAIVVPLALLIVLLVLYFQFKTVTASLIHFSGVFVAFAGGFILLWLYAGLVHELFRRGRKHEGPFPDAYNQPERRCLGRLYRPVRSRNR